jgi:hypothetical protein
MFLPARNAVTFCRRLPARKIASNSQTTPVSADRTSNTREKSIFMLRAVG